VPASLREPGLNAEKPRRERQDSKFEMAKKSGALARPREVAELFPLNLISGSKRSNF